MPSAAKTPKLFKIVSTEFAPIHGGSGKWFAPKKGKPSKWMALVSPVEACSSGYHLIPARAIVNWLPRAPIVGFLCEAEGRGDQDRDGDKIAFAQAHLLKVVGLLDEKSMRLAAADMAERVLPIFYKMRPKDDRPAKAIQAARDFANGKIDIAASAAAKDAAWAAAAAAPGDAAREAASAAAAAGDAARDAGWAAARDVARDAPGIIIACAKARLVEHHAESRS